MFHVKLWPEVPRETSTPSKARALAPRGAWGRDDIGQWQDTPFQIRLPTPTSLSLGLNRPPTVCANKICPGRYRKIPRATHVLNLVHQPWDLVHQLWQEIPLENPPVKTNVFSPQGSLTGSFQVISPAPRQSFRSASPTNKPIQLLNFRPCASTSAGRTARDTSQSHGPFTSSARWSITLTFESPRAASRRKTALRLCDSIKVICQSGRSTARGIPGNPAPEPRSKTADPEGASS